MENMRKTKLLPRKRRMKVGFVRVPQELPDFWGKGWIDYVIDIRSKLKKK